MPNRTSAKEGLKSLILQKKSPPAPPFGPLWPAVHFLKTASGDKTPPPEGHLFANIKVLGPPAGASEKGC